MRRTRIKICGITRPEDAVAAADLGVDAIGLVFYSKSARHITCKQALGIVQAVPPFVTKVALFFNNTEQEIVKILNHLPVDLLQFHGEETAEFCVRFDAPYIKAIPMLSEHNLVAATQIYQEAQGFLLDAVFPGEPGGAGKCFDWNSIPHTIKKPLIVAGGLNSANVADCIRQSGCYAVDVSSGVESAKGIKDWKKMKEFVEQVRMANHGSDNWAGNELF